MEFAFIPYVISDGSTANLRVQYLFKTDPNGSFLDQSTNEFNGGLCTYKITEGIEFTNLVNASDTLYILPPADCSALYVYVYFTSGDTDICTTDLRHIAHDPCQAKLLFTLDYSKISSDVVRGQYIDIGNWRFSAAADGRLKLTNILAYNSDSSIATSLGSYYFSVPDTNAPEKTLNSS